MPENPAAGDAMTMPSFEGRSIARCKVGELLGKGHYATVWRAHYEPLDKDIALKILSPHHAELEDRRERFVKEARAIAQVDHENIVKVFDVVEDQDHMCILMEYVPGETLKMRIKATVGGALPPRKSVRIALQMARALEAAHAEKIVHRDIKPGNVILTERTDDVKVVDFGLAAQQKGAGTPIYMSPEACQGKRIDEKSDVYALGVCLYHMLVGTPPYTGKTTRAILQAHVTADLVPPSTAKPDLGIKYDDIVKKLLVPSKGYRPTAAEAVELLAPLLEEPSGGKGRGRRGRKRAPAAKKGVPAGVLIGGIGGALILGVGALFLMQGDGETDGGAAVVETPPSNGSNTALTSGDGDSATGTDPVEPPPPQEDPLEKEYLAVVAWVKANPDKHAEAAERFKKLALGYPGTPWAAKANTEAVSAEGRAEQAKKDAERRAKVEEREKRIKAERDDLVKYIKAYDFERASSLAEVHTNVPGETVAEWRKKKYRLEYLAKNFKQELGPALESGRKIPASKLKSDAGEDEVIVGFDEKGVKTMAGSLPRSIPWAQVDAAAFFDSVAKRKISQSDVKGNLFLAILAQEIGLEKKSKQHREACELVDTVGDAKARVRDYFTD